MPMAMETGIGTATLTAAQNPHATHAGLSLAPGNGLQQDCS